MQEWVRDPGYVMLRAVACSHKSLEMSDEQRDGLNKLPDVKMIVANREQDANVRCGILLNAQHLFGTSP